ncbi:MAG: hypothetical protein JNM83_16970 [Myxococcales bacterium]|nr:hypothetical protein [Myxococcales bacterium]
MVSRFGGRGVSRRAVWSSVGRKLALPLLSFGLFASLAAPSRGDGDSKEPPTTAPPPTIQAGSDSKAGSHALLGAVDEITRKVVAIRGLPMKSPFARGVLTRQEITLRLKERIHNDYSPEEVRGEALMLKRMGLLPVDADYEKLLFELLSEQVAGFYDPYRKTLYVADWLPLDMQRPALAHEIQHALQDQHFDLKKLARPLKSEGDRQLAQAAVVEGDGTAVMMEFAARGMGVESAQLPTVLARLGRQMMQLAMSTTPSLQQAPAVLRESLMFPYAAGLEFVAAVRADKPWSRIDAVFRDPPVSTEQVLHPDKYLSGERPWKVTTASLTSLPQYKELRRDVLGELMYKVWFSRAQSDRDAEQAAAGWGGDLLVGFAQEGETLPLLVALSGWDTEKDAVEAEQAAQKLVQNLTGKSSDKLPPPGKSPLFERHSGDRSFAVARRGQKLLIVCGVPSVSTSAVVAEIFRSWSAAPIGQVAP